MAFTSEQLEAINKEGSNIIVSAGAGSGKTAVLTERVIRKIRDGVDVSRLLVLTFTNEAANEMKSRIRASIIKNNLDNQLSLLDSAYITTFDSYALSVVKKYHYLLNIKKDISIVDANIIQICKYKEIDAIFDEMYGNEDFNRLINDFCLKDDSGLKEYIIKISSSLDLLSDKNNYLDCYIDNYYNLDFINKNIDNYVAMIRSRINELSEIYERLASYCSDKLITKIDNCISPLINGKCYEDYVLFKSMDTIRYTGVSEEGHKLRDEFKEKLNEIKNLLRFDNIQEIRDSIFDTKKYANQIIYIIRELDNRINNYKSKYDIYEFNDIAHMAIDVIKNNSDIRDEIKNYFNEIMLDEYQDTSTLQEEFINLISNNNVYMVGDIKQSIYRFRNANPYIFRDKYDNYSKNIGGVKIDLLKNFRSRNETLNNINEIFNLIMDNEIGDAEYLESHNMVYGNTAYDLEDTHANNNLLIYNYNMEEDCEYTREEKELFIIASDINKKMSDGYKVFDKKTSKLRNIRYSDICIITDRNKYLDQYKKILEYNSIPTVLYKDEVLTNDTDILVIKNLINLVDLVNKKVFDDKFRYLFTSVARSFLFCYSDECIYKIFKDRLYREDKIVKLCMEIDMDLPINDIINNILDKFMVYDKLTTLNDIDKSLVRISNLQDIASNLSGMGYDISMFTSYLNDVIDRGLLVKYSVNTSNMDAVKIMNIHKSKGLEFSLCYFTGMHNKFLIKEISEKILFSNTYGIIIPYMNDGELEDTIYKDMYANNYFKCEISEKIRLFYVALTRCREKMIIVTSLSDMEDSYDRLVPSGVRIKYRSFLDILKSTRVIQKYITNMSANYTHDYDKLRVRDIKTNDSSEKIVKKEINIDYTCTTSKHFSKETKKLLDMDTIKAMEYGTLVHESLEYADFYKRDNKYVNSLLEQIDNNFINVYHEYEFMYFDNNVKYHGIIDLMLEYQDYINIVDYKLKNIDDENYIKQLTGYKNYISKISNKDVNIYLYSIMDNKLRKFD